MPECYYRLVYAEIDSARGKRWSLKLTLKFVE